MLQCLCLENYLPQVLRSGPQQWYHLKAFHSRTLWIWIHERKNSLAQRLDRVKLTEARQPRGNPSLPFISPQSLTPSSTPYMHRYYYAFSIPNKHKISNRQELKLRKIKSIQIVYLSYSSQPRRSMNGHVVNLITTAQPQSMYGSLRV